MSIYCILSKRSTSPRIPTKKGCLLLIIASAVIKIKITPVKSKKALFEYNSNNGEILNEKENDNANMVSSKDDFTNLYPKKIMEP